MEKGREGGWCVGQRIGLKVVFKDGKSRMEICQSFGHS